MTSNRLWTSRDKTETLLSIHRLLYIPTRVDDIFSTKTNIHEAKIVCDLVEKICLLLKNNQIEIRQDTLGVITPYRAQIALIRRILEKRMPEVHPFITIDTVERYQGGARDIIILSLCSNKISQFSSLISLSEDGTDRKLNVALTRAKEQIIITGNEDILVQNETYRNLIKSCHRMEWEQG